MKANVFTLSLLIGILLLNSCSHSLQTSCPTFNNNSSQVHYAAKKHVVKKDKQVAKLDKQKSNSVTTAYLDAEPIAKPEATAALVPLQLNTVDAVQTASTQAVINYMPTKISVVEKENNSVTEQTIATTAVTTNILPAQNAVAAKVNTMSDARKAKIAQRLDKLVKKSEQRQAKIANKNVTKQKTTPEKASSGDRSQLLAGLLAWFLGLLGIHRFYLGYMGIGLIQLLTLGGLGIWALIDLIRIIIGDLEPKNGRYR
jgi:hypothetical protein